MKTLVLGIFAAILIAVGYLYLQPKHEAIYGRALVLAFSDMTQQEIEANSHWARLDLTLRVEDSCKDKETIKLTKCISKQLKKALTRTQELNKKLIVLADEKFSLSVLESINHIENSPLAALVLLNPKLADFDPSSVSFKRLEKMLVINDINNNDEILISARQKSSQIRNLVNWVWSTQLVDSGAGLYKHPVLPHMVSYLVDGPINASFKVEFTAESSWQHPIVNNEEFWKRKEFVETHSVSDDIQRVLKAFYAYDPSLLRQWPLQTYHAFNLMKYRSSLPKERQGRYLTFSNLKGHKFFLDLDKYGDYQPELVIGIDDEKNLYRLTSFYKTKRYYSWEQDGPAADMLYSQSLGAFIHFQNPLPRDEELPYLQYSTILFDSISFIDKDPYAHIQGLTADAFKVVTLNCLPCHSVDGVGGAAHHLDYKQVTPQPGVAKPLLSYPLSVLENFFFNQTQTAELIGVNPNYVEDDIGRELITWLQANENNN